MSYTVHLANHPSYKRAELTTEGLEEILEYSDRTREVEPKDPNIQGTEEVPSLREDHARNTILVAAGYKEGAFTNLWADSEDEVENYVETLNDMGVNVGVDEELEHGCFVDPEGIYVELRLSRRHEDEEIFDSLESDEEKGRFLGYPEQERKAFERYGAGTSGASFEGGSWEWNESLSAKIRNFTRKIIGKEKAEYIYPVEFLQEKHGLSDEEVETMDLINYMLLDDEDSIQRAKEESELRKRVLDAIEESYEITLPDTVLPEK